MLPLTVSEGAYAPSLFPQEAGISLKPSYFRPIQDTHPDVGFFEIHAENYLSQGGPNRYFLEKIRHDYPITIHGVGLSIGGQDPLNQHHLKQVASLVREFEPIVFSEHLAWSGHNPLFLNDLLPLPYTRTTLDRVCTHIHQVQDAIGRPMLLENPATYLQFNQSEIPETDFLAQIVQDTGCQLLLDLNNVEVSCFNHQQDPNAYLDTFPLAAVRQIHLAGYQLDDNPTQPLKIDTHNREVAPEVWSLYERVCRQHQSFGTLIEWDGDLPPLATLVAQAHQADQRRQHVQEA